MMWNGKSTIAIASIAMLMLAGCGGAATPSASGKTGSEGSAAAGTGGSSRTSSAPTPSSAAVPSAAGLGGSPATMTRGSAHVTMSGGASQEFDVTLNSGILIPGSNVILSWSRPPGDQFRDDALRIQAPSAAGVYRSAGIDFAAPQISVTTGRVGTAGVPPQFAPVADECTVTLMKVDPSGVEGSLECRGLTSTTFEKPIDLSATYTAAP